MTISCTACQGLWNVLWNGRSSLSHNICSKSLYVNAIFEENVLERSLRVSWMFAVSSGKTFSYFSWIFSMDISINRFIVVLQRQRNSSSRVFSKTRDRMKSDGSRREMWSQLTKALNGMGTAVYLPCIEKIFPSRQLSSVESVFPLANIGHISNVSDGTIRPRKLVRLTANMATKHRLYWRQTHGIGFQCIHQIYRKIGQYSTILQRRTVQHCKQFFKMYYAVSQQDLV